MALSDSVGLLFRIKSDSSQATSDIQKFRKTVKDETDGISSAGKHAFTDFAQSIGLSTEQTAKLSTALPIVGAAIAGIAAVAVSAGVALFTLAKNASDFGSEINDASEKTGLHAEALSALKVAAEQSGSSFEQVTKGVTKFTLLVGDAARGSDTAKESLKRLGLDPQEALKDLDGSLSKVIKRIFEAKPGFEQNNLAADAFGKKLGSDLIPTINATKGNFEAFIEEAKKLGLVLTDADAKAADEFGDTLDTLKAQAQGVAFQFAKEFMPLITGAMKDVTKYLADNRVAVKEWGKEVGSTLTGLKAISEDIYSFAQTDAGRALSLLLFGHIIGAVRAVQAYGQIINPPLPKPGSRSQIEGTSDAQVISRADSSDSFIDTKAADDAKKAEEKRQQDEIAALQRLNSARREAIEQSYKELQDITTANYVKGLKTAEQYHADFLENERVYTQVLKQLINDEYDTKAAQKKNKTEGIAIETERRTALEKIDNDSKNRINEGEKLVTQTKEKEADKRKKVADDEVKRTQKTIDEEQALRDAGSEKALARLERNLAQGLITEEQFLKSKQALIAVFDKAESDKDKDAFDVTVNGETAKMTLIGGSLKFRLDALKEELIAVKGNADEETRITNEIKILRENAETEFYNQQIQNIENLKKISGTPGGGTARDAGHGRTGGENSGVGGVGGHSGVFDDGFLGGLVGGLGVSITDMLEQVDPLKGIGDIIGAQFNAIASAVGNAVHAFVLFGSAGGSFRKFVAEMLSSIAQASIVQALWETAQGFAMLALAFFGHPTAGASATQHFIAAGVYAGIGGVAAIAGRSVAGGAFKDSTNQATGQGASASAGGGRTPGNDNATPITLGANQPMSREPLHIKLSLDSKGVLQVLHDDISNNGKSRKMIVEVAHA